MTILRYPLELPQKPLVDGYGQEAADLDLASQTDIGPAKVRREQSSGVDLLNPVMSCTDWEKERLLRFYKDEARGRTVPWLFPEPGVDGYLLADADGLTVLTDSDGTPFAIDSLLLVRFVRPIGVARAPWPSLKWRMTMSLERLP